MSKITNPRSSEDECAVLKDAVREGKGICQAALELTDACDVPYSARLIQEKYNSIPEK